MKITHHLTSFAVASQRSIPPAFSVRHILYQIVVKAAPYLDLRQALCSGLVAVALGIQGFLQNFQRVL